MNTAGIRTAPLSDADAIFPLLSKFAKSYRPMRAAFDANFPGLIEDERYDVLVAERDGHLARYLLVSDSLTLFANGIVTELLELYVNEEDRGRGIGRELVDQAVSRARDRGAVEVTVPTRRARSFYLAMGFEPPAEFFKLSLKI